MKMANRPGYFAGIWQNIKKSMVIFRTTDKFVGSDQLGNRYFERVHDPSKDIKRQRRVEPRNPDPFVVPKVPTEWMTWLQGRRIEPPTEEEIGKNEAYTARTQMRASEIAKQHMAEDNENKEEILQQPQKKQKFPVYSDYEVTPGDKSDEVTPGDKGDRGKNR